MKLITSHPTSNILNRSLIDALLQENILFEFYTCIACFPGSLLDRLSRVKGLNEINRRRFDLKLKPQTKTWPWREAGRQIAIKSGFLNLINHETGIFSVDAVYKSVDKRVASGLSNAFRKGATGIYAYEDGAIYSFREAKRLGMQCLYDLPIGYWRSAKKLMKSELEQWPEWAPTLTSFTDSDEKLVRKDEELELADRIFVASSFTAETLNDYPSKLSPVELIPPGFPEVFSNRHYSKPHEKKRLKLLFVGGLSQRKGIANLFNAVEKLSHQVELTLVGLKVGGDCNALNKALSKHTWIPSLPHNEILNLMRSHDVLVFPSLFEGFGMVITEAMSQGTPVITTERTAGPDLITHGENGWLVKAGSTESLLSSIQHLIDNPNRISETGRQAMISASKRPWSMYRLELAQAINKHMHSANNFIS